MVRSWENRDRREVGGGVLKGWEAGELFKSRNSTQYFAIGKESKEKMGQEAGIQGT